MHILLLSSLASNGMFSVFKRNFVHLVLSGNGGMASYHFGLYQMHIFSSE
jgi:hypothetical protein